MNVTPRSILVFRNGSIGNTLVAVPALRALRRSFPDARLTVVVDPLGFELLAHCPHVDHLIAYDKRGRDRGVVAHARLIRTLRAARPTHAVLFKRFFRNGLLARLSGARVRAGFVTEGKAPFLNLTTPYDETVHHVDMNLRLVELLGGASAGRELELTLSEADHTAAAALLSNRISPGSKYVCAHYGGSTWFTERCIAQPQFIELLKRAAPGQPVVLVGAGERETAWAERLAALHPAATVLCNLPVRVTAALIHGAELLVGFNSGPSHIAAAVGTPLLMLFEPNERTAAQITRWLPPTPLAIPLIPPADPGAASWERFFTEAAQAAVRFGRTTSSLPR